MQLPAYPSLLFLVFILVLMPLGARRTAARLRSPGAAPVSRILYWRSGVITQLFILLLAWGVGRGFGYGIFVLSAPTVRDIGGAAAALVLVFLLRELSNRTRSESERRSLEVYKRAPRTPTERAWFVAAALTASVAEEAAYRGVGFSILWYSLGNGWVAGLVMAIAFALAHWNQGWKSGVTILLVAAILQVLVVMTNTLVLAMIVHAVYDLAVGFLIARRAARYDGEAAQQDGEAAPANA